MCRIDDAGGTTFSSRTFKARTSHKCSECRRTISPKETYCLTSGVYDGLIWTNKMCSHCKLAARWLQIVCRGYLYDQVLDELTEHWAEETLLRSWTLRWLITAMRCRWIRLGKLTPLNMVEDRMNKWYGDYLAKQLKEKQWN